MPNFLGMPSVIAHNAFAKIQSADGVVTGVPLKTAEHDTEIEVPGHYRADDIPGWVQFRQLVERDGKYYERSAFVFQPIDFADPRVKKGMSDLQLFDAVSGQVDRHGSNIFVDPATGAVTGIDDDWSFGAGQPANDVAGRRPK